MPESYEFAPPEVDGKAVEVDAAALDQFKAFAKEAGLTQEQFQALGVSGAKLISDQVAAAAAAPYSAWSTLQKEWQDAIKADPEIGGDKLNASLATARLAVDRFGGADLKQALAITGAGNNPVVVRAFVAIGRAMQENEGSLSTGKAPGSQRGGNGFDAIASRLYPSA